MRKPKVGAGRKIHKIINLRARLAELGVEHPLLLQWSKLTPKERSKEVWRARKRTKAWTKTQEPSEKAKRRWRGKRYQKAHKPQRAAYMRKYRYRPKVRAQRRVMMKKPRAAALVRKKRREYNRGWYYSERGRLYEKIVRPGKREQRREEKKKGAIIVEKGTPKIGVKKRPSKTERERMVKEFKERLKKPSLKLLNEMLGFFGSWEQIPKGLKKSFARELVEKDRISSGGTPWKEAFWEYRVRGK